MGLQVYPREFKCPRCFLHTIDVYGDHAVHCRVRFGYKHRHDRVRDILCSLFYEAGIKVVKEAPVSFLSSGSTGSHSLRPADILVPSWNRGKSVCIDVTGVSPMVSSGQSFTGLLAISQAVKRKHDKHDLACSSSGYDFMAFGFDTFGGFSEEATQLVSRLQRGLTQQMQVRDSVIIRYSWRRIGFAIFKGLAMQLASRWPD
jgi:hypothetical protein